MYAYLNTLWVGAWRGVAKGFNDDIYANQRINRHYANLIMCAWHDLYTRCIIILCTYIIIAGQNVHIMYNYYYYIIMSVLRGYTIKYIIFYREIETLQGGEGTNMYNMVHIVGVQDQWRWIRQWRILCAIHIQYNIMLIKAVNICVT